MTIGRQKADCAPATGALFGRAMSARTSLRVAVFSLVVLGAQAAYAAPAHAIAGMRARHCCAAHCRHAGSAAAADRCCHLRQSTDDLATLASPRAHLETQVHLAVTAPALVPAGRATTASAPEPPGRTARAAPLFLLTRTLRL
jgi:hypothetical protein